MFGYIISITYVCLKYIIMWLKKIKVGFVDFESSTSGIKNQNPITCEVRILNDLNDKYHITFVELINRDKDTIIHGMKEKTIIKKDSVYNISEIELNWFQRKFGRYSDFNRLENKVFR